VTQINRGDGESFDTHVEITDTSGFRAVDFI
jgi:hypothetical protein